MNLKTYVLIALTLAITIEVCGQTACVHTFKGRIVDHDGNPVAGASIMLSPSSRGESADSQGNFVFSNLCAGRYSILIRSLGFKDLEVTMFIKNVIDKTIELEEVVTELDEVLIQHHDAAHTEHAVTYSQLDEPELAETAGKSLGQTLRDIAGVNTTQTGPGIFKPVVHGMQGQRILLLNNGVRLEGQQWGAEHAPEIDPFIASNIVVIKDASALKYGTDALGGVIVVNPPALPESAGVHGTAASVLQSNGRSGALAGMLEGGFKKLPGWGWRVQSSVKKAGDYHAPKYSLTNTGGEELNYSAAFGYHRDGRGLDIFFSHYNAESGILKGATAANIADLADAMDRRIPSYTSDFSYDLSEPRQSVQHNFLKLQGHIRRRSGEWRMQYGYQNNHRREFAMRPGLLSKVPSLDLSLNTHTVDAEWETLHSDKRTLSVGFSGTLQNNLNNPGIMRIPFIPNFTNGAAGVFSVSKFFRADWTFLVGGRYDMKFYQVKGFDVMNAYYRQTFDFNGLSASGSVERKVGKHQTVSLNLSTTWRAPHVSEMYSAGYHQSAASIEYGLMLNNDNQIMSFEDAGINTEKAVKLVGSYGLKTNKLFIDVSPYFSNVYNYIYLSPVGVTTGVAGALPALRYQQTSAQLWGTDVSGSWRVWKFLTVSHQASLLRARETHTNEPFLFIPANRFVTGLRYERPFISTLRNFYLETKGEYVAEQTFAPRVITIADFVRADEEETDVFNGSDARFDFLPASRDYFLLKAAVGFSIHTKRHIQYDVRLACENLTNSTYREYTNRFRYYADDAGRNFSLSVKCIF